MTRASLQCSEQPSGGMQHVVEADAGVTPPTDRARASCARCGAALPLTKAGIVKAGIRFCREACRLAAVRDRRAAARAELAEALHQIREQLDKAEDALAVLGLLPRLRAD